MHTSNELVECKTVLAGNKKLTLDGPYLEGLIYQAAVQDRGVVVSIELFNRRWILMPEDDYIEHRDQLGELDVE